MVDYGILEAIRRLICDSIIGIRDGLSDDNVYTSIPEVYPSSWPAIFIELEEAWSPKRKIKNAPHAKISFKVSILCNNKDGDSAINISNEIIAATDGLVLFLDGKNIATFRLKSSILDFKKDKYNPRKVEQFYEAIINSEKSALKA